MNTFTIKILCLLGLLLIVNVARAEDCDYPIKIESGQTFSECGGVILSDGQFIESANTKKKLRVQDLKIAEYEGLEELYELRNKGYIKEVKQVKAELRWLQIKSNFGYIISFGFGAAITALVIREVSR